MRYSVEDIAEVCWNHNLALQAADKDPFPDEPWLSAPKWRKDIVRVLVERTQAGAVHDARECHELWRSMMRALGWNPGEKDPLRRTHPNLRPWEKLEDWQRLAQRSNFNTIQDMSRVS